MGLDSTPDMKPALRLNVGGVGFFGRIEHAKVDALPVNAYIGKPLVADVVPVSANKVCRALIRARPSFVLRVLSFRDIPQIAKPVVGAVVVNVVNIPRWVFAVHKQPHKAVGRVALTVNSDEHIPVGIDAASNAAARCAFAAIHKPCELAGIRVIAEKFAQALRGKIGLSHEALQLLIGQRLGSVDALAGPRYFSA
jgi:hypothetical protein